MAPQSLLRNLKQPLRNAGEEATAPMGKADKGTLKSVKNILLGLNVNTSLPLVKH